MVPRGFAGGSVAAGAGSGTGGVERGTWKGATFKMTYGKGYEGVVQRLLRVEGRWSGGRSFRRCVQGGDGGPDRGRIPMGGRRCGMHDGGMVEVVEVEVVVSVRCGVGWKRWGTCIYIGRRVSDSKCF